MPQLINVYIFDNCHAHIKESIADWGSNVPNRGDSPHIFKMLRLRNNYLLWLIKSREPTFCGCGGLGSINGPMAPVKPFFSNPLNQRHEEGVQVAVLGVDEPVFALLEFFVLEPIGRFVTMATGVGTIDRLMLPVRLAYFIPNAIGSAGHQ